MEMEEVYTKYPSGTLTRETMVQVMAIEKNGYNNRFDRKMSSIVNMIVFRAMLCPQVCG